MHAVLIVGVLLFLWIAIGGVLVTAHVAGEKNRSIGAWVCVALFFSPFMALLALAALPTHLDGVRPGLHAEPSP
jgi:hypothetical protein